VQRRDQRLELRHAQELDLVEQEHHAGSVFLGGLPQGKQEIGEILAQVAAVPSPSTASRSRPAETAPSELTVTLNDFRIPAARRARAFQRARGAIWNSARRTRLAIRLPNEKHFERAEHEAGSFGLFIRRLVGLDRAAAKHAFADFLDTSRYTANQIEFVNLIIDELSTTGVIKPERFYQSPFTDVSAQGPDALFESGEVDRLLDVVGDVHRRAESRIIRRGGTMVKDELTLRIRSAMVNLADALRSDPGSLPLRWILPDLLACGPRPLRYHPTYGGRSPLPSEARPLVIDWVEQIRGEGIHSILCLLEVAQHQRYYGHELGLHEHGLLGYCDEIGFEVVHQPLTDYQRPDDDQLDQALTAFKRLPKPVLVFCSAAIDRTPPVVAHLVQAHPEVSAPPFQ
jgi:Type I site-specific restriction-modification system, R (restriction) subunit and related helicases